MVKQSAWHFGRMWNKRMRITLPRRQALPWRMCTHFHRPNLRSFRGKRHEENTAYLEGCDQGRGEEVREGGGR
ncbi:hypothetical protein J4Q44_G00335760 [Coregonus suidteri]|uniref:Uncharacterized protein n=1 Tax=Coregonus suidteri TaxID=861788 RepID=A0AAN8QGN9_9TELE